MVPLVDMLKETVLRIGWLDAISSVATGGGIRPDVLAERLLLAIYAYSQVAFESGLNSAFEPNAGRRPRRHRRFNTGIALVLRLSQVWRSPWRHRSAKPARTPGERFTTVWIVRANRAARPHSAGRAPCDPAGASSAA
jgi:hypothetical protein